MIREILDSDRSAIAAIQAECYPEHSREDVDSLFFHSSRFPQFCVVGCIGDRPCGYLFAHPWPLRTPPPVNLMIYEVPNEVNSVFVHDLALSVSARGCGLATQMVKYLIEVSRTAGYKTMSLISVQNTRGFWEKFDFRGFDDISADYFERLKKFYPNGGYLYMEKSL